MKTRQDLYAEAFKAAPGLTNGCIRCRHKLEDSSPVPPARNGPLPLNVKSVLIALVCLPLALLILLRGGWVVSVVGSVPGIGPFLADPSEDFAGLVMFALAAPGLYFLWRAFAGLADLHTSRSSLRRMSACPREGIVFEDILAARDMICPSCKEDREPIRSFRVVGTA
jgi:hypothetical protein